MLVGPIKIARQTPSVTWPKPRGPYATKGLHTRDCIQPLARSQDRRCTMAIMDANYDQEMMRLWGIISDLSDQLNEHRATASMLRNQAEGIKVGLQSAMDAIHSRGSHTRCSSVLEPGHPHSDRLCVAQVCIYGRCLTLHYAHMCVGLIAISHRVCTNSFDSILIDPYF